MSLSPQERPRRVTLGSGIGRRSFVGSVGAGVLGATALGAGVSAAQALPAPSRQRRDADLRYAFLGTYGSGIISCTYDTATGALTKKGGFPGVVNPSFLALSPSGKVLYSLDNGGREGAVRAFTIGAGGALTALGPARSTGGANVTHLSVHPTGRHLLSANYGAGSIAAHTLNSDGSVGARTSLVQHTGSGPDPTRQEGPHAHQILTDPAGAYVFAVDLGTDKVYTYRLVAGSGTLRPVSEAKSVPGAGPRHMVFHPTAPYAYVANELNSTISIYAYNTSTGVLTRGESQPTLPGGSDPGTRNYPAEVVISADGRFVYLSNRGHESVARFAVTNGGAGLRLVDTVPCGGSWPRHISLSPAGTVLFAANQYGRTVGTFTVHRETGALTSSGTPFATVSSGCVLPV
ncbi:lactonase family protein [Streptomyces zagrosensis]|uniref:6-phosphogluconolactonase (Cycloisomerase 2 family) n=1 Tax=Streptomyces zagrosensis TaxID=1042984 RepID=A0A7W9QHH5_9ACTN|nr:lactonase family protein [Streptomyces zagrosensis]MBB5939733.1 6-phosphogluconolactonase (cycloisomerase 2 family) [Streptomyces zagrosensis]